MNVPAQTRRGELCSPVYKGIFVCGGRTQFPPTDLHMEMNDSINPNLKNFLDTIPKMGYNFMRSI